MMRIAGAALVAAAMVAGAAARDTATNPGDPRHTASLGAFAAGELAAGGVPPSGSASASTLLDGSPALARNAYGGEGVSDVGARRWHQAGLTGVGTTVAVIDTGFDEWDLAAAAGEVPRDVVADLDFCDEGLAATNHGTATSEIIYDMAPEVDVVRVCVDDAMDLAEAVPEIIARDVDVVNMSIGFFNTSRGDGRGGPGSPDASARRAIDAGILWVNSAGNEALVHHAGTFRDPNGNGRHDWRPGQELMRVDIPARAPVDVFLKWDQWGGAPADDFAICLTDDPSRPLTCVESDASSTGRPTASLGLRSPFDREATLYAAVERRRGTTNPRLDLTFLGAAGVEYPTKAASLAEPAAVEGVITVGAYCTDGRRELRPYSSRGPTLDGRPGVSLVAPGSVSGLLFGEVVACQGGYGGTSAAAPHVAGALGLIRQDLTRASGAEPTPAEVEAELVARTDGPLDEPPDPATGHGRLTMGAPRSLAPEPTTTTTTTPPTTTTTSKPPSSTTTTPPSTTAPPVNSHGLGLAVSDRPDRSDPRPLEGETLAGGVYVFVSPVHPRRAVERVRFFADGELLQVERFAGYDLGGGTWDRSYPFDTWRLGDGRHDIVAEVTFTNGETIELTATIEVDNGGVPPPPQPFELVVVSESGVAPLHGASLTGAVDLRLAGDPPEPVRQVLLYVDAFLVGADSAAPFETSRPVDLAQLGSGSHAAQAIVRYADGTVATANAVFTSG